MNKKRILLISTVSMALSATAFAVTSYLNAANSIRMTVTGMYLGNYTNGKCQGWQTVFENTSATAQDFTQSLDIGGGSVSLGSFGCIALRIVNSLDVTVNSNAQGNCVGWNGQKAFDSSFNQNAYDITRNLIGSSSTNISRTGTLYLYFRVGGTNANVYDPSDGAPLNQAITVTAATTTLNFKFKASAGHAITDLQDGGTECTFDDPNVGFSVQ